MNTFYLKAYKICFLPSCTVEEILWKQNHFSVNNYAKTILIVTKMRYRQWLSNETIPRLQKKGFVTSRFPRLDHSIRGKKTKNLMQLFMYWQTKWSLMFQSSKKYISTPLLHFLRDHTHITWVGGGCSNVYIFYLITTI